MPGWFLDMKCHTCSVGMGRLTLNENCRTADCAACNSHLCCYTVPSVRTLLLIPDADFRCQKASCACVQFA